MQDTEFVPASSAAYHLKLSRERVVRLLQRRVLAGRLEGGRWLVDPRSIEQFKRQRPA